MKKIWYVGQMKDDENGKQMQWEIQGIFEDKDDAIKACVTDNHFISSLTLNLVLPNKTISRNDYGDIAWYPLQEDEPKSIELPRPPKPRMIHEDIEVKKSIIKIYKWFIGLFESNGKTPQLNNYKEDYEAEYIKIKDTAIMRGISICLMGDGGYKVRYTDKPDMRLMDFQNKKKTKEQCLLKCISYYKSRVREIKSNIIIEEI